MGSAQIQLPGLKWREATVKIDDDTFMKVQYLFNKEVTDYTMLASLVSGGYDFGRAWVVNARGVTEENSQSQEWRAYAEGSRAAMALLENSSEHEIISKKDGITHVTDAQRGRFQAFQDMAEASLELARNPRDPEAIRRAAESMQRFRRGREESAGRPVEEAEIAEPVAEIPNENAESKAIEPPKSEFAPKEGPAEAVGKAPSFRFYTPDDPQHISYGFEIHWKDGYSPKGDYDPSDIWSVERFLFSNLDGIQYYDITGFVDGRFDGSSGTRQFSGDSFPVEYMRRAFLRLEDEIGGETVRLYVPRGLDVSGKTFADLISSPDMVAISVVEEGKEKFIWDIYAQEELLAALQKRFPDMGFTVA
jgi:hypothetical protein